MTSGEAGNNRNDETQATSERHMMKAVPSFSSHFPPTACCLIAFSFLFHFVPFDSLGLQVGGGKDRKT